MDAYFFYLISGIAVIFSTIYIIAIRGILYHTPDTDNELMAYAAAQSHQWRWISDVHKFSASTRKASMKECTIVLISFFQKIFRDKTSDLPYTAMTGLSVSLCTVLIYLITSNYFNPAAGLIVSILYIISFWPWQVSLYGGHANMANLFFLLSIYAIQLAAISTLFPSFILVAAGGGFLGLCLFSSPSSYKYSPAIFVALFFNEYGSFILSHDINAIISSLPINYLVYLNILTILVFLSVYIFALTTYRTIVRKIYNGTAPNLFNNFMSGKKSFSLEHYINHANKKIKRTAFWVFCILFLSLLIIDLISLPALLAFTTGFIFIFLTFTLPNIKENVAEYIACALEHKKKTHFRSLEDYFSRRGITVQRNTRGAGLSWIPKLLWRFIPFHTTIYMASLLAGIYLSLSEAVYDIKYLSLIAIVSLLPIISAELTKAPQASRLYSPSLVAILLLPAYIIADIEWTTSSIIFSSGLIILIFIWNLNKFINDVYPARMTVRNFLKFTQRLKIDDIYTYDTNFNAAFINAVPGIGKSEYLPDKPLIQAPFKIHYIQQINEVRSGWIAIPGTSSKAITTTSEIENGDFKKDLVLNRLIETKQIEKIATAKFKTYGTSSIWVNEDDITSYRALHLKDIGPEDLYRGYAWLIHSDKLKSLI